MNIDTSKWLSLSQDILKQAQQQGANAAEINAGISKGFSVQVRMGEVETIEHNQDKGISITVYYGQRKGSASTSDSSFKAMQETLAAACHIARFTSEDKYAGLADIDSLAKHYPDLNLYHPWDITVEQAIKTAKEVEAHGLAVDARVVNSDGVNLSTHEGWHLYANTHGFMGYYPVSSHSLSCSLIAQDASGMQRDYDYTSARDAEDMQVLSKVAQSAADRALQRLNAKRLQTAQVPVIFQARIASSLISHFIAAIRGSNLYRKSSFLLDHLHKPVFAAHINISEQPHLLKALGSAPFDAEGVTTSAKDLIKEGILQNYILGSYAARHLGMQTTGNAGGIHNVIVESSDMDLPGLLKGMGTGLLVTELMGQGINILTGDYSRGASGFWVEKGEIQYPVEEITIAGNLRDMFLNLIAVGNDVDKRGNIHTGSILLDSMTIAGQ